MSQQLLLRRIIGPDMERAYSSNDETFTKRVVKSFLNILLQSLYGGCRDLKEIVRLGRSLWPLYVLPLHSTRIDQTLKAVKKNCPLAKDTIATTTTSGKYILSYLDHQILTHMRQKLNHSIYTLRDDGHKTHLEKLNFCGAHNKQTSGSEVLQTLPYLTKCLLLAAFICQTNRADKDKQLFTIQKNGKKNSTNKRKSPTEDIAFGAATKSAASKFCRPRMFPMERMLSVFVSIVGLNQEYNTSSNLRQHKGNGVDPSATGSPEFFESLSYLRDVGLLHDNENLATPRYWCSLTKDEAEAISQSVNFQLGNYLF